MQFKSNLNKLQQQLCELKLEERRVRCDISTLVKGQRTIDFYKARELNRLQHGIRDKIAKVESKMMPNIIA
jgi:hypothetical protein